MNLYVPEYLYVQTMFENIVLALQVEKLFCIPGFGMN